MTDLVAFWTYPIRRLGCWLRSPEASCSVLACPRPRVGFSRFCRDHTDAILAGHIDGQDA